MNRLNTFFFIIIPIMLLMFDCLSQETMTATASNDLATDQQEEHVQFEVNIVAKGHTLSLHKLQAAKTLVDLNKYYKPSWVRTFHAVDISVIKDGRSFTASSKNDELTQEQRELMLTADSGTPITATIQYIPENTLTDNDMKTWDFSFVINPYTDATFPGGKEQLNQYLTEHAINHIPTSKFKEWDLTPVLFTIDETGKVINTRMYEPSDNPEVDELLIRVINNMPRWTPAGYSLDHQVKQDFVLTVGNMKSCLVNVLHIRPE